MSKNYIREWAEGLLVRQSLVVAATCTVVGARDKHLGPRNEFAKVELSVDPAQRFELVDLVEPTPELAGLGYPDWVLFGVLDILMLAESAPITAIRITLRSVETHPIDSSPMALRQAGRDAGRKIVAQLVRGGG